MEKRKTIKKKKRKRSKNRKNDNLDLSNQKDISVTQLPGIIDDESDHLSSDYEDSP